ncbi:MAG TPA: lysophospholipid acyltransferase family protein [Syntrophorhabdaceae bacterium]|nr:lysophospholipid acyltransferase family protein [Syntrophorhabdaceae bacterium]HPU30156.1 lysophospholipid acyltransferase family protein [Syntrophorhabdaceae bacterium]
MNADFFIILTIKIFQCCLRLLPERFRVFSGISLGRLAYHLLKKRRLIAISNLKRVFKYSDEHELKEIAKRCFERFGINFVELLLIPYLDKSKYNEHFFIENRDYIESALEMEKGVLAIVFHYSNWEIMGIASTLLNRDIIALARPLKRHKKLNDFLNSLRSSTGLKVIPNEWTGKAIMRFLKENKIVALLADQRVKRSKGILVDFFGEKVFTNKGPALLAMKTGAPVIPVYLSRRGFLRYNVVCGRPIEIERKGDIENLIEVNTRKLNAFLETIIMEAPEEWFWVHRRWGRNS